MPAHRDGDGDGKAGPFVLGAMLEMDKVLDGGYWLDRYCLRAGVYAAAVGPATYSMPLLADITIDLREKPGP
jgi:hypothetical protein